MKPRYISPVDAFCVLRAQFGQPNNLHYIDKTKTQWGWYFAYRDYYLHIYDYKLDSISIAVYRDDARGIAAPANESLEARVIGDDCAALIGRQTPNLKSILRNAQVTPAARFINNAYVDLYTQAERLLARAEYRHDHTLAGFFLYMAAVEGLVNIIYEIYLKKALRTKRIHTDLIRRHIDLKIQLAPRYCTGFDVEAIDPDSSPFMAYHRLANKRNDIVHANITEPYRLVEEEGYLLLLMHSSNDVPELSEVKTAVDGLTALLGESMNDSCRRDFEDVLLCEDLIPIALDEDGHYRIVKDGPYGV